jgi:hypothetical protein
MRLLKSERLDWSQYWYLFGAESVKEMPAQQLVTCRHVMQWKYILWLSSARNVVLLHARIKLSK